MVAPSRTDTIGKPAKKTRVRISKSGQITLPAKIRKQLDVKPGEYVDIIEHTDGWFTVNKAEILMVEEIAGMARPLPPA